MKFWLMQRTWVRTKITVGVVTVVLPLELCAASRNTQIRTENQPDISRVL